MNIFKVLAARKRFPEEMSSALLGWLLHPNSEHGIGRSFLNRFLLSLGNVGTILIKQLNDLTDDEVSCNLEEDVGSSQLDIIVFLGDCVLAIENKIHNEAVAFGQLQKEYEGLLQKFPDKTVVLVYLVPDKSSAADAEYRGLIKIVEHPHSSVFMTWLDNISGILHDILHDEPKDNNMIPQETSVVLQMLHEFVIDRFKGYNFMHRVKRSGEYSRYSYAELTKMEYGFVGVENGTSGLMKLSKEAIQGRMFPFDTVKVNVYWMPLNEFLAIANIKMTETTDTKDTQPMKSRGDSSPGYMGKFNATDIYEMICSKPSVRFYIGIKGGERAFLTMERSEIDKMSPKQVTTGEQPNSQWITGDCFRRVYEIKFPERTKP